MGASFCVYCYIIIDNLLPYNQVDVKPDICTTRILTSTNQIMSRNEVGNKSQQTLLNQSLSCSYR